MIRLKNIQFFIIEYDIDDRYLVYNQSIRTEFKKMKCSRIFEIGDTISVYDKNHFLNSIDCKEIDMVYKGSVSPRSKALFSVDLLKIRRDFSLNEIFN